MSDWIPRVYFAGKVRKSDDYRQLLLGEARVMSLGAAVYTLSQELGELGVSFEQKIEYAGPWALACDHGCFHQPSSHGLVGGTCDGTFKDEIGRDVYAGQNNTLLLSSGLATPLGRGPRGVVLRCLEQVRSSDLICAYLDEPLPSCYGTLVELGYAAGLGKPVLLVVEGVAPASPAGPAPAGSDLWFAHHLPNVVGGVRYGNVETLRSELIMNLEQYCKPKPDQ